MSYRVEFTTAAARQRTSWRIRIGDYRVLYDILDSELTVSVVRAAHRREVYDR